MENIMAIFIFPQNVYFSRKPAKIDIWEMLEGPHRFLDGGGEGVSKIIILFSTQMLKAEPLEKKKWPHIHDECIVVGLNIYLDFDLIKFLKLKSKRENFENLIKFVELQLKWNGRED